MSGRPTRYCSKCGEYVDDRLVSAPVFGDPYRTVNRLAHIDADGNIIHRAHAAKEAT